MRNPVGIIRLVRWKVYKENVGASHNLTPKIIGSESDWNGETEARWLQEAPQLEAAALRDQD